MPLLHLLLITSLVVLMLYHIVQVPIYRFFLLGGGPRTYLPKLFLTLLGCIRLLFLCGHGFERGKGFSPGRSPNLPSWLLLHLFIFINQINYN